MRFLAWQDEWKTNQPAAARHPDGSPVTDKTELDWLKHVMVGGFDVSALQLNPEPRFVYFWFSHPLFDSSSVIDFTLLDESGKVITAESRVGSSGSSHSAKDLGGDLGWFVKTISPGAGSGIPSHVTIRLRYAIGPLERTQTVHVKPNNSTTMNLEGGGTAQRHRSKCRWPRLCLPRREPCQNEIAALWRQGSDTRWP